MRRLNDLGSDALVSRCHSDNQRLRALLQWFIERAVIGELTVRGIPAGYRAMGRGAGHLHMGAELFLQVSGETVFHLPHATLTLGEAQALVMPPKLLHDEHVTAGPTAAFSNLVIYADKNVMTCHMAYEESPGKPGIWHLEQCRHVEAARIQGWLADAAQVPAADPAGTWTYQKRALVLTVLIAVQRLLDAPALSEARESPLLSKLRVLVHNRLGDANLTVAGLAQSLGCSADYLSHLYSDQTGEHLRGYIQRQRLSRAAGLLAEGQAAIKEVAWCCGFSSTSYFIRSFKNEFGQTPGDYRNERILNFV